MTVEQKEAAKAASPLSGDSDESITISPNDGDQPHDKEKKEDNGSSSFKSFLVRSLCSQLIETSELTTYLACLYIQR